MRRPCLILAAAAALGCGRPRPTPLPSPALEPTCPEAVQTFASAERIEASYQEIGPLSTGDRSSEDTVVSRRERAAAMGANGILLGGGAPMAIYIPADAQAVRDICAGGNPRMVRAVGGSGPDAVGYALQGSAEPRLAADTAPVVVTTAEDTRAPDRPPQPERATPSESARLLSADRELRQALSDVTRLRVVAEYRETRPGLLTLTLGDGYSLAASVEYNLGRLERAYADFIHYEVPVVLELLRDGEKIGEYTKDGLLLGPRFSRPR